jgi:pyruvate dehydrogenase E2 component (dihydrolipoamide acetyltransferase)
LATEVVMPALGVAQETGTLVRWLKRDGEPVASGEPLMEIETDKVTVEIESPANGVLSDVRAADGDEVPVGDVVAVIRAPDESPAQKSAAPVEGHRTDRPSKARPRPTATAPQTAPTRAARKPSSPLARRRAKERGIDLSQVSGRGEGGAVVLSDVDSFADALGAEEAAGDARTSAMWRRMAERTARSWTSAPHFYLLREVDATRLVGWYESARHRVDGLTYTDLLVRLVAATLKEHREINTTWDKERLAAGREVNVGVAVATGEGLVVPVIHGAGELPLEEISARRRDLVERARARKLRPDDVHGGTFTVSNLGMYGVDAFTAVINPPQAAILTAGSVRPRVVADGDRAVVRHTVVLGLCCDHRAVDGARAGRFLQSLAAVIEEPLRLMS